VTPYCVGRCPKDRGYGHPLGAPSPTDGYFTHYERRGELRSPANNDVYRQTQTAVKGGLDLFSREIVIEEEVNHIRICINTFFTAVEFDICINCRF